MEAESAKSAAHRQKWTHGLYPSIFQKKKPALCKESTSRSLKDILRRLLVETSIKPGTVPTLDLDYSNIWAGSHKYKQQVRGDRRINREHVYRKRDWLRILDTQADMPMFLSKANPLWLFNIAT